MEAVGFWVGFAASAEALLKLSGEVIKLISDARSALAERHDLLGEIIATKDILDSLKVRAEQDDWKSTMSALNAPDGPLYQFQVVWKL